MLTPFQLNCLQVVAHIPPSQLRHHHLRMRVRRVVPFVVVALSTLLLPSFDVLSTWPSNNLDLLMLLGWIASIVAATVSFSRTQVYLKTLSLFERRHPLAMEFQRFQLHAREVDPAWAAKHFPQ